MNIINFKRNDRLAKVCQYYLVQLRFVHYNIFNSGYGDEYCQGSQRLDVTKDRLAVPSISPDQETEAARSRRKKAPRPKSAPKRSSSSPMADYTSPEEEEVFSEEEIKLPLDEYEEEKAENEAANNDADGQFRIAESANDQVNDWQDQNC